MSLSISTLLIILAVILLPIAVWYFSNKQENKIKDKKINDPRSYLTPNNTNYNIDGRLNKEFVENASQEEIREMIEKFQKGDLSSLSPDDFYLLKERLSELQQQNKT